MFSGVVKAGVGGFAAFDQRRVAIEDRCCQHGEFDRERRPMSPAIAAGADRPAVRFDQPPRDRQPEPQTGELFHRSNFALLKRREELGQDGGVDARAGIDHLHADAPVVDVAGTDDDRPLRRR